MVGEQGIKKSETGEGAWTRSHAGCFAAPLPLLEGAGSEFSTETNMGRIDRATWIDRSILDVRNGCPWMGRSEFKHDDPAKGGMNVTDEKSGHTETSMSRVRPQSPL